MSSGSQARVRDGTALRKRGKDRVRKILRSARSVFLNDGYNGLSLRRVADIAGISLGNLTYYFKAKADLFESMINDVLEEYSGRWEQISKRHADDPAAQLDAFLSYLFADCQRAETQQFFYQFWAVASHDRFVATTRDRMYAEFHEQLTGYCRLLNSQLADKIVNERVLLLMAQVEGLHVIFGMKGMPVVDLKRLEQQFKRQVLATITS